MNKVIAKNGARHDAEKLFADLQEYTRSAIRDAMKGLVSSFGIACIITASGQIVPTDHSLLPSYILPGGAPGDYGTVTIAPGFAITPNLDFLDVTAPQYKKVKDAFLHTLYIVPTTVPTEYTAVVNGYYYQPATNTVATRQTDFYEFVWEDDSRISTGLMLADVNYSASSGQQVER